MYFAELRAVSFLHVTLSEIHLVYQAIDDGWRECDPFDLTDGL